MSIFSFLKFLNSVGFRVRPEIPDIEYDARGFVNYIRRVYQVSDNENTYKMTVIYSEVHYHGEKSPEDFLDPSIFVFGKYYKAFEEAHTFMCTEIVNKIIDM